MSSLSTQVGRVEHYEFVAMLMSELPRSWTAKPNAVAGLANGLVMLARKHTRLCEAICNGEAPNPNWDRLSGHSLGALEQKIRQSLDGAKVDLGPTGLVAIFNHDPRGATVKLKLPSGRSNSFGGEGWCVP